MTLAFFGLAHEGLYGVDDTLYARYAARLAEGTLRLPADPLHHLHDPLLHRPAVYGPVALCFRWFGISVWTATLWPLLATLATGVAIFMFIGKHQPLAAAGAIVLLGLSQHILWLATYLYGDNVLLLLSLLATCTLWRYREGSGRRPVAGAALFVGLAFAAFLAKETIVWHAPAWLWLLVLDWRRGRHRRFWAASLLLGTAVLLAYFGFYQYLTGDAFQRFRLIETTNEFLRSGNYATRGGYALLTRLTWEPLMMLAGSGLGVLAWPAALAAARRGFRQRLLLRGSDAWEGPWLAVALFGSAFWWWGSTSLHFWNPISLLPRMLTPLLPVWAVLAGVTVREWRAGRLAGGLPALGFLVLAIMAHNSLAGIYLLLAIGAAWWGRPAARRPTNTLTLAAIGALLVLRPAWQMAKPSLSDYRPQQAIIRQYLTHSIAPGHELVLTDGVLLDQYDFWYDFRPPARLTWRDFAAADTIPAGRYRRTWLLINEATLRNPDNPRLRRTPPETIRARFPHKKLITKRGRVELWELTLPALAPTT